MNSSDTAPPVPPQAAPPGQVTRQVFAFVSQPPLHTAGHCCGTQNPVPVSQMLADPAPGAKPFKSFQGDEGGDTMPTRVQVQCAGFAYRMSAGALREHFGRSDFLAERSFVVGLLILKFSSSKHVLCMDHKQKITISLQMDVPSIWRCSNIGDWLRISRISAVNDRKAF